MFQKGNRQYWGMTFQAATDRLAAESEKAIQIGNSASGSLDLEGEEISSSVPDESVANGSEDSKS